MGLLARLFRRAKPAALARREPAMLPRRNFAGALVNRLTFSLAQSSSAVNAELDNALVILRSRARGLCANNEYGRRFLTLVKNNIVGPKGPMLQVRRIDVQGVLDKPLNDAIEEHWRRWGRRCDVTGKLSFALLLQNAVAAVARDGETLVRVVRGRQYRYGFALQLLEADRLDETLNRRLDNGNLIRQGVEIDSRGKPLAYWLWTTHPGENWNAGQRVHERVPAENLYHIFLPERAEQVRGYTWMHAVVMRANMLGGYEEAAIIAARVGAAKAGVFTRDPEASGSNFADAVAEAKTANGVPQMSAEPGEFLDLTDLPGVKLESWDPEYPHGNFESFVKQCMRGWAMGVDVATHNLSGDMEGVNYSSARIAELAERDVWMARQDWLIDFFVGPVFEEWLNVALLTGEVTFLRTGKPVPVRLWREIVDNARFQGRRWKWVDPQKEIRAAAEAVDAKLESRTAIAASQGRDFEDIVEELRQEQEMLRQAGITTDPAPPRPPLSPEPGGNADES